MRCAEEQLQFDEAYLKYAKPLFLVQDLKCLVEIRQRPQSSCFCCFTILIYSIPSISTPVVSSPRHRPIIPALVKHSYGCSYPLLPDPIQFILLFQIYCRCFQDVIQHQTRIFPRVSGSLRVSRKLLLRGIAIATKYDQPQEQCKLQGTKFLK
jgi:hypothetical protein